MKTGKVGERCLRKSWGFYDDLRLFKQHKLGAQQEWKLKEHIYVDDLWEDSS